MTSLVTLGPLALPTLKGDVVETIGDQLEAVGAGVVAGERRPRPFPLTIPVRGDVRTDASRWAAGMRLRRQLRALIENPLARLQGLYLNWSVDPEQNCWLLVGGGDLKYAMGGVVFGDFEVELTDCYRVANVRTHRPARRVAAADRRLITTPRDFLGTSFATTFASTAATPRAYMAANATDLVAGSTRFPINTTSVTAADGSVPQIDPATDGEIVDFEQAEGDMNRADVKVWDRQGAGATEASWERVYGPDQPLTVGDVPVIENGVCRATWDATNKRWDVYSWISGAWALDATVVAGAVVGTLNLTLVRATVVEWTPERTVVMVTGVQSPEIIRVKVYVTLQRGWSGPRFEIYGWDVDSTANVALWTYSKSTGDSTFQKSTGGAVAITSGGSLGTFSGLAPHASVVGPGTDRAIWWAVVNDDLSLLGAVLSSREGVSAQRIGYVSIALGLGPRASAATDATQHGKNMMYDTQTIPELVARA